MTDHVEERFTLEKVTSLTNQVNGDHVVLGSFRVKSPRGVAACFQIWLKIGLVKAIHVFRESPKYQLKIFTGSGNMTSLRPGGWSNTNKLA